MNAGEIVQEAINHLGVMQGADVDFGLPETLPCVDCGAAVDLSSLIDFTILNPDGSEEKTRMTEANARQLIAQCGLTPPEVMCERHG